MMLEDCEMRLVRKDIVDFLHHFSDNILKAEEGPDSSAETIAEDIISAAGEAVGESVAVDEEKVPIETPEGAKAMAMALSRVFGGWRGGCRLSPSANRANAHHLTVFCSSPKEMGERMLNLREHLISQGYKEISEGVFRNANNAVYQGRSYARRGGRPLAFMVTVEVR
jgi:hypothetical protein